MDDLLTGAADYIIERTVSALPAKDEPQSTIRALALGVLDAIDAHPWLGAQLAREPHQSAVFRIWKGLGQQLQRLGLDEPARSNAGSALVNYDLGVAAQHTASVRRTTDAAGRQAYLDELATAWLAQDPDPLVHEAASLLREHDDRDQFHAGVDIFLAGITATDADQGRSRPKR